MTIFIILVVILILLATRKRRKTDDVQATSNKGGSTASGGCLSALLGGVGGFILIVLLVNAVIGSNDEYEQNDNSATATPRVTSTQQSTATQKPTNTPYVTSTPKATNTPALTNSPTPAATPMPKPGISGSNAYDITVTLDDMGFDIGKRQETATKDGYAWYISGIIGGTSYIAQIETNREYEIYDATFMMTGTDATYLPWAATLPHDLEEQDSTVAWVKQQQSRKETGTITVGDAIWTYTPSKAGGTLRVQSVDAAAYADALLDQLISGE